MLPDERFGFVHGKAGVVDARRRQRRSAFIGSTNESRTAWTLNYELLWSDDSAEGVAWVQEEFDALWADPAGGGPGRRGGAGDRPDGPPHLSPSVAAVADAPTQNAAAVALALPLYQRENGLWAHQKYFVQRAFEAHRRGGARLVLADQVGLGKTVQLALAAKLMALWGGGRVLVVAPKTLLGQWQDELWTLLALPSAVWTGRGWEDEQGIVLSRCRALRGCDAARAGWAWSPAG